MVTRYVKINGRSYPIKLCQTAILRMAVDEGLSTEQLPAVSDILSWPVKHLCLVILHSIKIASKKEGIPCELTLDDIIEAVSEDAQFQSDMGKLSAESQPTEVKKKVTTKAPQPKSR